MARVKAAAASAETDLANAKSIGETTEVKNSSGTLVDVEKTKTDTPEQKAVAATRAVGVTSVNGILDEVADQTISVDPSTLDFGTIKIGESKTMQVTVSVPTLESGNVLDYVLLTKDGESGQFDDFAVSKASGWKDDEGGVINVVFTAAVTDTREIQLSISSNQEGVTPAVVAITAKGEEVEVIPDPELTTDKTTISFVTAKEGDESQSQTIVVTAKDLKGVITSAITNTSAGNITMDTSGLDANKGGNIVVIFKPTAEGSYTETITLKTEGVDDITIPVSATVEAAEVIPPEPGTQLSYVTRALKLWPTYAQLWIDDSNGVYVTKPKNNDRAKLYDNPNYGA